MRNGTVSATFSGANHKQHLRHWLFSCRTHSPRCPHATIHTLTQYSFFSHVSDHQACFCPLWYSPWESFACFLCAFLWPHLGWRSPRSQSCSLAWKWLQIPNHKTASHVAWTGLRCAQRNYCVSAWFRFYKECWWKYSEHVSFDNIQRTCRTAVSTELQKVSGTVPNVDVTKLWRRPDIISKKTQFFGVNRSWVFFWRVDMNYFVSSLYSQQTSSFYSPSQVSWKVNFGHCTRPFVGRETADTHRSDTSAQPLTRTSSSARRRRQQRSCCHISLNLLPSLTLESVRVSHSASSSLTLSSSQFFSFGTLINESSHRPAEQKCSLIAQT